MHSVATFPSAGTGVPMSTQCRRCLSHFTADALQRHRCAVPVVCAHCAAELPTLHDEESHKCLHNVTVLLPPSYTRSQCIKCGNQLFLIYSSNNISNLSFICPRCRNNCGGSRSSVGSVNSGVSEPAASVTQRVVSIEHRVTVSNSVVQTERSLMEQVVTGSGAMCAEGTSGGRITTKGLSRIACTVCKRVFISKASASLHLFYSRGCVQVHYSADDVLKRCVWCRARLNVQHLNSSPECARKSAVVRKLCEDFNRCLRCGAPVEDAAQKSAHYGTDVRCLTAVIRVAHARTCRSGCWACDAMLWAVEAHGEGTCACVRCGIAFASPCTRLQHLLRSGQCVEATLAATPDVGPDPNTSSTCFLCGQSFPTVVARIVHQRDNFHCQTAHLYAAFPVFRSPCGKRFASAAACKAHAALHASTRGLWRCEVCCLCMSTEYECNKHFQDNPECRELGAISKKLRCRTCFVFFSSEDVLKMHLLNKTCAAEKPHSSTVSTANLSSNIETHTIVNSNMFSKTQNSPSTNTFVEQQRYQDSVTSIRNSQVQGNTRSHDVSYKSSEKNMKSHNNNISVDQISNNVLNAPVGRGNVGRGQISNSSEGQNVHQQPVISVERSIQSISKAVMHNATVYLCGTCSTQFPTKASLDSHIQEGCGEAVKESQINVETQRYEMPTQPFHNSRGGGRCVSCLGHLPEGEVQCRDEMQCYIVQISFGFQCFCCWVCGSTFPGRGALHEHLTKSAGTHCAAWEQCPMCCKPHAPAATSLDTHALCFRAFHCSSCTRPFPFSEVFLQHYKHGQSGCRSGPADQKPTVAHHCINCWQIMQTVSQWPDHIARSPQCQNTRFVVRIAKWRGRACVPCRRYFKSDSAEWQAHLEDNPTCRLNTVQEPHRLGALHSCQRCHIHTADPSEFPSHNCGKENMVLLTGSIVSPGDSRGGGIFVVRQTECIAVTNVGNDIEEVNHQSGVEVASRRILPTDPTINNRMLLNTAVQQKTKPQGESIAGKSTDILPSRNNTQVNIPAQQVSDNEVRVDMAQGQNLSNSPASEESDIVFLFEKVIDPQNRETNSQVRSPRHTDQPSLPLPGMKRKRGEPALAQNTVMKRKDVPGFTSPIQSAEVQQPQNQLLQDTTVVSRHLNAASLEVNSRVERTQSSHYPLESSSMQVHELQEQVLLPVVTEKPLVVSNVRQLPPETNNQSEVSLQLEGDMKKQLELRKGEMQNTLHISKHSKDQCDEVSQSQVGNDQSQIKDIPSPLLQDPVVQSSNQLQEVALQTSSTGGNNVYVLLDQSQLEFLAEHLQVNVNNSRKSQVQKHNVRTSESLVASDQSTQTNSPSQADIQITERVDPKCRIAENKPSELKIVSAVSLKELNTLEMASTESSRLNAELPQKADFLDKKFHCANCHMLFLSNQGLQFHLKKRSVCSKRVSNLGRSGLLCWGCVDLFETMEHLRNHLVAHPICARLHCIRALFNRELRRHLELNRAVYCEHCCEEHLVITAEARFRCRSCCTLVDSLEELVAHIKESADMCLSMLREGMLATQCPWCGEWRGGQQDAASHLDQCVVRAKAARFRCRGCSCSFPFRDMLIAHRMEEAACAEAGGNDDMLCGACNSYFTTLASFEKHHCVTEDDTALLRTALNSSQQFPRQLQHPIHNNLCTVSSSNTSDNTFSRNVSQESPVPRRVCSLVSNNSVNPQQKIYHTSEIHSQGTATIHSVVNTDQSANLINRKVTNAETMLKVTTAKPGRLSVKELEIIELPDDDDECVVSSKKIKEEVICGI